MLLNFRKYNNSVHTLAKNVQQTNKERKHNKKQSANHSGANNGNQTNRNANSKPSSAVSKEERVCYWCEKRGHSHKADDKKTWTCPDYLAGKEPCASWVAFQASKGYAPAKRIVATMGDPSHKRAIALTSDISFKGIHGWFNNEKTILDLGGCDNLVNSNFVSQHLRLPVLTDTSAAAQHIQQSVNGDKFKFTSYAEIMCNFNGHREKIRFYLMKDLPLPFLLGYPFFLERGAIFDLNKPTVVLSKTNSQAEIKLISTASEQFSAFNSLPSFMETQTSSNVSAIFCNFKHEVADITNEDAEIQLQQLLLEFESVFDLSDKTPAKVPEIDLKLKPEFSNKIFYCPEPIRSITDQAIIDRNAAELIAVDRAYLNPFSKHNIGQVIVHRFDKAGAPIVGRERVCLNLIPVNKCLEHFEFPIPKIELILQNLMMYSVFSELDLAEGFNQLRVSKALQQIFTFTCTNGKVSLKVLPFGVFWATSIFQSTMCDLFIELFTRYLQI